MNSSSTDDPRPIGRRTYLKALGASALMGSLAGCAHPTGLVAPPLGTSAEEFRLLNTESSPNTFPVQGAKDISMTTRASSYVLEQDDLAVRASFVTIPIPTMRKDFGVFKKGQDISPWLAWLIDDARVLNEHPKETLNGDHGLTLFNQLNIVDTPATEIDVKSTQFEEFHEDQGLPRPLEAKTHDGRIGLSAAHGDGNWADYLLLLMKGRTVEPDGDASWDRSVVYFGVGQLIEEDADIDIEDVGTLPDRMFYIHSILWAAALSNVVVLDDSSE